jgi:hypothetical protein
MPATLVSSAEISGASGTLPTHAVGDTIIIFAYRDGSTTAPSLPANYQNIDATGANTNAHRIGWRTAQSTADSSGTWTNASRLVVQVWRPTVGYRIRIGNGAAGGAASTTLSYTGFTLTDASSGRSRIAAFAGHRSTNCDLNVAVTNLTNDTNGVDATCETAGKYDTAGGRTTWTTQTQAVGGTSSGWRTYVLELIEELRAYDEDDNAAAWMVAGARTALAGAMLLGAAMSTQARALTFADSADEEPSAAATPITGSAGAGVRVQPLNAGFKQPRAAIADAANDLPTAAPTVTLDDDGFTARVSWPVPPPVRVVVDDGNDLPFAAVPNIEDDDDGVMPRAPWATQTAPRVVTDTDEVARIQAFEEDAYVPPRPMWPVSPSVRAFTDDEEEPTPVAPSVALEHDDAPVLRAAWPLTAPVRAIADDDELPVTPDPMTGSAPAGIRVQPINAGFKAPRQPIAGDDDLPPQGPPPEAVPEDEGTTPRTAWPRLALVRPVTDDGDLPIAAAPSTALDESERGLIGTHAPADFLVSHPTGFGIMDEVQLSVRDPNDAWAPPAPWTFARAPRPVTDADEVPTAVAPTLAHENEVGPVRPTAWPRFGATVVTDDDTPTYVAPTPIVAEDDAPVLRAAWTPARTPAVVTDDGDLPITAAPAPALADDDAPVLRAPWPAARVPTVAIDADERAPLSALAEDAGGALRPRAWDLRTVAWVCTAQDAVPDAAAPPPGRPGPHPLRVSFASLAKSVAFTPMAKTVAFTPLAKSVEFTPMKKTVAFTPLTKSVDLET